LMPEAAHKKPPVLPIYNPYPPGLLPKNLVSEMRRVQNEIRNIYNEALKQWDSIPPPTIVDNPPVFKGSGLRLVQILGKLELFDTTLSVQQDIACSSCHMPYAGFSGPMSSVNATTVAYPGSVDFRFGKRKPQSYTYSPFFPALDFNLTQGDFYGGNFWDARATGWKIQNADAEQAQHPPLDTQEHGLPDIACIVLRLSQAEYRPLFEQIWGTQAFDIRFPSNTEKICRTPGGAAVFGGDLTPVKLTKQGRGRVLATYDQFALSITAYERSEDVSAFSSKFDAFIRVPPFKGPPVTLTADEGAGGQLFRGKGKCNTCHVDDTENSTTPVTVANLTVVNPLFTDFTYNNIGIPRNPMNPFYFQNVPDPFGFTPNPIGKQWIDSGVGYMLRSEYGGVNPNTPWIKLAPLFDGKVQTSTVRNVDMRPCPTFVKAYMHNGYLKSLKEVVHFYNTRDVFAAPSCAPGTEKKTCWPPPEVPANVNMTIGRLGLTDKEEDQIVAFMKTLTDGFTRPYTDFNQFTGKCP